MANFAFSKYFKQHLGIILNGKKYIYVNTIMRKRMSWLAPELVDTCGGGFKVSELYMIRDQGKSQILQMVDFRYS
jgi:hypothetical protein